MQHIKIACIYLKNTEKSMLVTDPLKLASDEKSTVHGKEFHTLTTLSNKEVSTSCVITAGLTQFFKSSAKILINQIRQHTGHIGRHGVLGGPLRVGSAT